MSKPAPHTLLAHGGERAGTFIWALLKACVHKRAPAVDYGGIRQAYEIKPCQGTKAGVRWLRLGSGEHGKTVSSKRICGSILECRDTDIKNEIQGTLAICETAIASGQSVD